MNLNVTILHGEDLLVASNSSISRALGSGRGRANTHSSTTLPCLGNVGFGILVEYWHQFSTQ